MQNVIKSKIMKRVKKVHFIGIGGSGMSGIASILNDLGYEVTGSDLNSSKNTEQLIKKGIDISGKIGDDLFSSSDGMVVYTGNGIKGYGNLIIIKHNETFLSAYAHTSKILVEENNLVKQGQVIAKLGDTDSIKPLLHFQIRKNGKSVDPEKYLP